MDFEAFDQVIEGTELDLRPRIKTVARQTAQRELADVPEDVVALILPSRLGWLARRAREIERDHLAQIDELLNAFASDLTSAALWEKKKCELIAVARRIAQRELADVPDDLATQILPSRLDRLTQRAQEAFERGRAEQIDELLNKYAADLRGAVLWERQNGALKPVTPSSELKRCQEVLAAKEYHSAEFKGLLHLLRDGERIRGVHFRQIETSTRIITRADIFGAFPFDRVMTQELRERMFVAEHVIATAERREREDHEAQLRSPGSNAFIQ